MSNYKSAKRRPLLSQNHFSQVKLPSVQKKFSHQQRKPLQKIKSGKLPLVNVQTNSIQLINQNNILSELDERCVSQVIQELPYKIEQQVHNILNRNQSINEYYISKSGSFQSNIRKHKEILKLQREKRESVLQKIHEIEDRTQRQDYSKGKKREVIVGRRFSSKLRGVETPIPHRSRFAQANKDEQKMIISQQERRIIPNRKGQLEKKMKVLKDKISKRTSGKVHTQGTLGENSQNLFDSIHNYLTNPHRFSSKQEQEITSSKIEKRKKILEEKLKNVQNKHCHTTSMMHRLQDQEENKRHRNQMYNDDYCDTEWRRVQFQSKDHTKLKKMQVNGSSFERQVSHLNNLQQRNQQSLERYIQNQRILNNLKLTKSLSNKDHLKHEFLSK